MKRVCGIILLAFFLSMSVAAQGTSAAIKLHVTNKNNKTIQVAVSYIDPAKHDWRTRGWFAVNANSTRDLTFDTVAGADIMYIHAHMGNITWGRGDTFRYVRQDVFDYYGDSNKCPGGTNRREVKFSHYKAINGVVNFTPTISK